MHQIKPIRSYTCVKYRSFRASVWLAQIIEMRRLARLLAVRSRLDKVAERAESRPLSLTSPEMEFDLLWTHHSEIRAAESHTYGKPHKLLDLRGCATEFHALGVQRLGLGPAPLWGSKSRPSQNITNSDNSALPCDAKSSLTLETNPKFFCRDSWTLANIPSEEATNPFPVFDIFTRKFRMELCTPTQVLASPSGCQPKLRTVNVALWHGYTSIWTCFRICGSHCDCGWWC